jgi:putative endonuclease
MDSTNLLVRTAHESNGRFAFNYNAVRVIPNRADGKGPHELAVFMQVTSCDLRVWPRSLACAGNDRGEKMKEYYVYMMTNRSRVVLYTGVTSRLEHRAWEHKNHVVEGFTSKYKLDRLVYYEQFSDPVSAITREKEIKSWRREKKNELVRKLNPKWEDLSESLFGGSPKVPRSPRRPRNDAAE